MDNNQLDQLIEKYLRGEATAEEEKKLMRWYREQLRGDVEWELVPEESAEDIKVRLARNISADINTGKVRSLGWVWSATALVACLIGLLLIFAVRQYQERDVAWTAGDSLVGTTLSNPEIDENRFIVLPDSSRVLLRPGSSLEYVNNFGSESREVLLVGEGYFDVRNMEGRPFIVHTGDIRTVVLGTAFTIKSTAERGVQVTVQRGKVRVENQQEVLGELTASEQLKVDTEVAEAEQKTIVVANELAWTAEGMSFDNETFGTLMKRMQKRYGTAIRFEDEAMQNCVVSGRFLGNETLDEVLRLLCATRNATFERTGDSTIVIKGEGCSI